MPTPSYEGTLRLLVTPLSEGKFRLEWLAGNKQVIWTEECTPKAGCAFASQIQATGTFKAVPGYFLDSNGLRHFVMSAECGRIGAQLPV